MGFKDLISNWSSSLRISALRRCLEVSNFHDILCHENNKNILQTSSDFGPPGGLIQGGNWTICLQLNLLSEFQTLEFLSVYESVCA